MIGQSSLPAHEMAASRAPRPSGTGGTRRGLLLFGAGAMFVGICWTSLRAQDRADASQAQPTRAREQDARPAGRSRSANSAAAPGETPPARPVPLRPLEITPEREQQTLEFVQGHHPALGRLLGTLKQSSPREYSRALRELVRTRDRLQQVQASDPDRYDLELKNWEISSRIRMTVAQIAVAADREPLTKELRELVKQQAGIQLELLEQERTRLKRRLEAIERQLEEASAAGEERVEQRVKNLIKVAEREGASKRAGSRSAPAP